jgi:UDP-N-acetyl-D-glucosamine dehydrogenase
MSNKESILNKLANNELVVGIIGLGYVGLPLAVLFAEKGLKVIGFEKSSVKAEKINRSENYISDVESDKLKEVVGNGNLRATTDFTELKKCDAIIICVPTPLDHFRKPDTSYIKSACEDIGRNMKPVPSLVLKAQPIQQLLKILCFR